MTSQDLSPRPCVVAVDDDITIRTLIRGILVNHGFDVVVCANGTEMWDALDQAQPRVILLDIEMPGEDGLVLAEALRARYGFGVAIIMLTASDERSAQAMAHDAGADDYLIKSNDWDRLINTVHRHAFDHI